MEGKFPKSLQIFGYKFAVRLEKNLKDDNGDKLDGCVIHDKNLILIDRNLSDKGKYSTLLHEAIHAVLGISGVSSAINSEEIEEAVVRAIENGLFKVIADHGENIIEALRKPI